MNSQNRPPILGWSDFMKTATTCGIDPKDVEAAANYLNDLGVLIHFNDAQMRVPSSLTLPPLKASSYTSLILFQTGCGDHISGLPYKSDEQHHLVETKFHSKWYPIQQASTTYLVRCCPLPPPTSPKHCSYLFSPIRKAPEFRSCRPLLLSLLQHFELIFNISPEKNLIPALLNDNKPLNFYIDIWPKNPNQIVTNSESPDAEPTRRLTRFNTISHADEALSLASSNPRAVAENDVTYVKTMARYAHFAFFPFFRTCVDQRIPFLSPFSLQYPIGFILSVSCHWDSLLAL